ncbi:hypothetical protein LTR48_005762 [Friedmanniomyces endolithicus]|uniref:Uncharacterized protein n=1 Tax=Rachicladosporium monterosium TaxID=1507873 RepID=A0ABR0L125_9PEZI|nr:hypothetical protein LTR48_005762 [Friedmanniomyces endolithicus]KAK5141864.1 hypothetical protein LTR32_005677 [Rachicladosporium monterosium]
MAEDWQVEMAKHLIHWHYEDVQPIRLALTAGDTERDDREGHRMLAQYGDNLVPFSIATINFQLDVSRREQNVTQILIRTKKECARRAKMCNLDKLVKISIRQRHNGPQPTVLKNTMFALVAAVWVQAGDWSHTLTAMSNLGRDPFMDPRELTTLSSPTNLFGVTVPYRLHIAEETAEQETHHSHDDAHHIAWNETTQFDERAGYPMELERAISPVTTEPMLVPPSSIGDHRFNPEVDFLNDNFDATAQSGLVSADGSLEDGVLDHRPNTYSSSRTNSTAQAEAPEHMHINNSNEEHTSA